MKARRLSDDVFVMGQPEASDFPEFAAAGITTVICNRPEGEDAQQPSMAEARDWAERAGLIFHHVPLAGPPTPEAVDSMAKVLDSVEGPVVAYCRSGFRSAALWALAGCGSGRLSPEAAVAQGAHCGYDLSPLAPVLTALSRSRKS